MPRVERDGVSLYYEAEGEGPPVAFVGDVGYGAWQWGWQHAAVAGPFRAITWDLRGTGRSDCPPGPYDVETLAADLEAVLAGADARRAHLVGAGLGGMVAVTYALAHGRARSLTLFGTPDSGAVLPDEFPDNRYPDSVDPSSTDGQKPDPEAYRESTTTAFSTDFLDAQPDLLERILTWRAADDASPAGWRAQAAAMRECDLTDRLHEVTLPALVIHGTDDDVVPVEAGERLAGSLPDAQFHALEGAGHLVHVERSKPVNDLLLGFLEELTDER